MDSGSSSTDDDTAPSTDSSDEFSSWDEELVSSTDGGNSEDEEGSGDESDSEEERRHVHAGNPERDQAHDPEEQEDHDSEGQEDEPQPGFDPILGGLAVEYISTNKGKNHFYLACGGYLYVRNQVYYPNDGGPESVTWECKNRKHRTTQHGDFPECRVKLVIKGDTIRFSQKNHNHTHPADDADIEVARAKAKLLAEAESTQRRTGVVVSRALEHLSPVAYGRMPDEASMNRTVQRKRSNQLEHPINPTRVEDMPRRIPRPYRYMSNGDPWLQWDSKDQHRTLIFACEDGLDLLSESAHWFVDGTFSITPLAYRQLYTIHALVGTVNVPCVYVLMRHKTMESYERVLAKLKLLRNMDPTTILLDFEDAAIGALRHEFPRAILKGCYFHLTKSVWKNIQRTPDARNAYKANARFALTCRMIPALAFLPPGRIQEAFIYVIAYAISKNHHLLLTSTFRYFARVYTGTHDDDPLYPTNFWSVADRVSNALPKSNNALEGWHNGLLAHIGCFHPPLWKFIHGLRQQNAKQEMRMIHALMGRPPRTKRGTMWLRTHVARLWALYRDHLEDLNTPLHGPSTVRFLKAIAHLYKMV